ncbi:MAG: elongation factor P [Phycisphaerae bacterium]|nr:elongation factor P [Phycisphaerae bacterium]
MSIKTSELKKGQVILHEGTRFTVKDIQHVAKGNWRSYYQIKLKDFNTGRVIEQRFAVDDRIETLFVQTKDMEYLYRDGDNLILADPETYDQIPVGVDIIGDGMQFLKENFRLSCSIIDGQIVSAELPIVVELEITDTPPVVRGATATNQSKEAILESGAKVRVPPFIEKGEVVRVDTRTGEYLERAK